MHLPKKAQLGLGLIGIGREWGHQLTPIPNVTEVCDFLLFAYQLGINFFDTAPAYGYSEARLGKFLDQLTPKQRKRIFVSTKFGEHWDFDKKSSYTDHSYDALCKSFDNSLSILKKIDMLQLHKTTPSVLKSVDLQRSIEYVSQHEEIIIGASVSDMESAKLICESSVFASIQIPYNIYNKKFETAIDLANQNNKLVLINRPYNMGEILGRGGEPYELMLLAYKAILEKKFHGYVLTGTKSIKHLQENWDIFNSIQDILGRTEEAGQVG